MRSSLNLVLAVLITCFSCTTSKFQKSETRSLASIPVFSKEGHRGARGLSPENTIPSFEIAMDHDVTTLELDIVISKDKKVVVSHDIFFHPDYTTTPQGKHLESKEAQQHLLYTMNYDSIKKYDVGLKPHKDFPKQKNVPAYKPLFSEMIDSAEAQSSRRGKSIQYNIELKTNASYDGTKQPAIEETVDLVMEVVKSRSIDGRYYLQSFDFRPLKILHQKYPYVVTAVLIGGSDKRTLDQILQELGYTPEIYSPSYTMVNAELVEACHKRNMKIIPWTVNSVEEMKRLINLKVDGIITDYPDYFSQL